MKIIISPAKKMNDKEEMLEIKSTPVFIDDTERIKNEIQKLSFEQAKFMWKCNDKLAVQNYDRYHHMDLNRNLKPAILSYEGLQYQHMSPSVFTEDQLGYIEKHLRILSGFYGILRPFDGITSYRLEMQSKLMIGQANNLYEFWGDRLYHDLMDDDHIIINLASKEYSQIIEKYLSPDDRFITIEFVEQIDGKLKQKSTLAKMARGKMVRFMAENQITDIEEIKHFHELGFDYSEEYSNETRLTFIVS